MSPDEGGRGTQGGGDLALQRGRISYCPSHHIGRVVVGGVGSGRGARGVYLKWTSAGADTDTVEGQVITVN